MKKMNLHTWELVGDDLDVFKEEIEFLRKEGHDITVSYTETFEIPEGFDNSGTKITLAILLASEDDQRRLKYVVFER